MYRHALPPGFVLKKDKKKEERDDDISMEELIENEVRLGGMAPRLVIDSRTDSDQKLSLNIKFL